MNLYGDWANVEVLSLELKSRRNSVVIDRKSIGDDVGFADYDFIYIGSGTERSLIACLSDIVKYKDSLIERINDGVSVLATGNSHEIFGSAITDSNGIRHEVLGLLDFETIQGNTRVTGDCVCRASFLQEKLIGFINRAGTGQVGNVERPFSQELGPSVNDDSSMEGIIFKNLLGTYMTGPVLVRNPPLLSYFADKLTRETTTLSNNSANAERDDDSAFFKFQTEAYKMALSELTARVK